MSESFDRETLQLLGNTKEVSVETDVARYRANRIGSVKEPSSQEGRR